MKDIIANCIVKVDTLLYKKLGIVTSLRKAYWRRKADEIQLQLNTIHAYRNYINNKMKTDYTTKFAIENYNKNI